MLSYKNLAPEARLGGVKDQAVYGVEPGSKEEDQWIQGRAAVETGKIQRVAKASQHGQVEGGEEE